MATRREPLPDDTHDRVRRLLCGEESWMAAVSKLSDPNEAVMLLAAIACMFLVEATGRSGRVWLDNGGLPLQPDTFRGAIRRLLLEPNGDDTAYRLFELLRLSRLYGLHGPYGAGRLWQVRWRLDRTLADDPVVRRGAWQLYAAATNPSPAAASAALFAGELLCTDPVARGYASRLAGPAPDVSELAKLPDFWARYADSLAARLPA